MKKKINMQFIIVSFIAIILTMSLSVGTFYELFVQEMRNDMKAYTHVLRSAGVFNASNEEKLNLKNEDLRITIIDADGTVVYDNEANDIEMDNHKDRPEIESALKNGEGSDVRKSSTLNKSTYYYAVLLDDGQVLRIAKEASSVWNIFIKVLPLILGIIILMLFSVGIITHYITKSIVKPVEELANNIDEIKDIKTYKEIQPFIDTIKKQHEDIVKNSHVRQEFTANVSHELKTPIALVQGYAEGLKESISDDPQSMEFYCDVIIDESNKMNEMVKKLLTLNQIEFGDEETVLERFDIVELLNSVISANTLRASQKDISITFSAPEKNMYVWADEYKIEEVVTNYISNAINHCDFDMKIVVRTQRIGDNIRVFVFNTGKHIPDEDIDNIWIKFYKVDKARTREYGGNGIGLSIVKAIMDSLGKECGVMNVDGGVEFWFDLDAKA